MHKAITEESDSVGERMADGCIHILGVTASVTGATVLLIFAVGSLPTLSVFSLSIYCTGLVAVFGFSLMPELLLFMALLLGSLTLAERTSQPRAPRWLPVLAGVDLAHWLI